MQIKSPRKNTMHIKNNRDQLSHTYNKLRSKSTYAYNLNNNLILTQS